MGALISVISITPPFIAIHRECLTIKCSNLRVPILLICNLDLVLLLRSSQKDYYFHEVDLIKYLHVLISLYNE